MASYFTIDSVQNLNLKSKCAMCNLQFAIEGNFCTELFLYIDKELTKDSTCDKRLEAVKF